MDWMERIFGVSPDDGRGTLEFLLIGLPLLGAGIWHAARRQVNAKRVVR